MDDTEKELIKRIWDSIYNKSISYDAYLNGCDFDLASLEGLITGIASEYKFESINYYFCDDDNTIRIFNNNIHSRCICKMVCIFYVNRGGENSIIPKLLISDYGIYYGDIFIGSYVHKYNLKIDSLSVIGNGFIAKYNEDGKTLWKTPFETSDFMDFFRVRFNSDSTYRINSTAVIAWNTIYYFDENGEFYKTSYLKVCDKE